MYAFILLFPLGLILIAAVVILGGLYARGQSR